jgi:hypothetical protein
MRYKIKACGPTKFFLLLSSLTNKKKSARALEWADASLSETTTKLEQKKKR